MKRSLALIAVLGLGLGACTVDNKDMAKKIKDSLNQQLGDKLAVTDVDCPSGKSMDKGTKFDCTAKFAGDQSATVHIEITEDKKFNFELDPDDAAKLHPVGGDGK